ncbi:hypothetical protein ATANTOWER_019629 [Ataeniobius toweri]|uniref:Uncharacterized protein n=1 Tax=Ataeniobius toweri TaxID=208326 RepID=A0ABU7BHK1_9TELE|nr:hypothetical protein [Ataeniobius toweri]
MALLTPLNVNCHASDGRKVLECFRSCSTSACVHHNAFISICERACPCCSWSVRPVGDVIPPGKIVQHEIF